MAERRMFAKTIIDSDAFLDMPTSTQALYFHLSTRADDEGFINNPKKIQRMLGCSDDDLKLLIAKRFIIPFDSGVVVIKHWLVHNLIRKDRLTKTIYEKEKSLLTVKSNGSYTINIPREEITLQSDVNQVATKCQHRLGKVRLGKVRLGKVSKYICDVQNPESEDVIPKEPVEKPKSKTTKKKIDHQAVIDTYNLICESLPTALKLTPKRKTLIEKAIESYGQEKVVQAFETAQESDFLKGKTEAKFTPGFDWIMDVANMTKILEGNYKNKEGSGKPSTAIPKKQNRFCNFEQRGDYDFGAIEEFERNRE